MGRPKTRLKLGDAVSIFIVANDPRFLFTRLRRTQAVDWVASHKSPAEIVAWVNQHGDGLPDSVEDLVAIYVHLAALALHDQEEVIESLCDLKLEDIPWAEEIVAYVRDSLRPTTYRFLQCGPRMEGEQSERSNATTTSSTMSYQCSSRG